MKKTLPMLPLRGKYIFPNTVIHFDVSRSRSVKAIEEAMEHDQMIFLNNQIDPTAEDPGIEDLYRVGTLARIKQVVKLPKNILRVFAEGLFRAELSETVEYEPFYKVEVLYDHVEQQTFEEFEREAFLRMIKEAFEGYAKAWPHLDQNIVNYILLLTDVEILVDELATHIPFSYPEKQKLLEEMDLKERCELMLVMLQEELDVLKLKQKIQQKVKVNIDKNQKEYVLREQIKVIREELGETNVEDEADEFMEKLKNLKASDEVKEKLKKEISRFQTMGNQTPESSVLRTYIETMFEVPWEEMSEDSTDLDHAQQVLDLDHYGMEKVKERVLEYLAARAMSGKKDAAILCLVGPPGTGKTSIARSIAKATNKKYIRLSLGGVRDESEIRGHRKTYVGAMPGRIVEALKKVKVRNPLMLLDEIDKTGKDQRGDTASALLEVLDPEQNEHFTDHYLEVALNLSDVLFVATANDLSTIPRPLLDRMEIIEVSSYTENEKYHIANDYLVKKQMEANGLNNTQIHWKEDALRFLITDYTREAGVRNLERRIDIRNNPGGVLKTVADMLDYILPNGLIVYTETKSGKRQEYSGSDNHELNIPMAVLVNGNSASASEIFAGAMQDYDKAQIIGTQTFGKGIVQTIRPLTDGSAVKYTIAKYFTPKGQDIHGKGVKPDSIVELPDDATEDVQLKAAVEYLNGKMSVSAAE